MGGWLMAHELMTHEESLTVLRRQTLLVLVSS